MDLLSALSDDQTALAGCAAALAFCGALMSLSYYIGRTDRIANPESDDRRPDTLRLPVAAEQAAREEHRRAA